MQLTIKVAAIIMFIAFLPRIALSQSIYAQLPVGKYNVGFEVITFTDSTRFSAPMYNYLGEKNEGDRLRKITVHLWYPAVAGTGGNRLTYGDYCYNALKASTNEIIDTARQAAQRRNFRASVERWFGKTTDAGWQTLVAAPLLARSGATPLQQQFPLLIGMLRPLSTSIINELLASNGYVVAMVKDGNTGSFAQDALESIPDMQYVINQLKNRPGVDVGNTGTFGFSGSGFTQVLFAMYDNRIKAVADIESGIYMDGLYQQFSASNYYNPAKIRAPFLHIFSRDLSKQEKFISQFQAAAFCKRYRLLLNQPAMHHWDFAAEGYTACLFLNNRGAVAANTESAFEIACNYMLNFFNAELKDDRQAKSFLAAKPVLPRYQPGLWDIETLAAAHPAPNRDELEYIIRTKGIAQAMAIVHNTIQADTVTNIRLAFMLNNLGYTFLNEKKYAEAIGIFTLNTELHPDDANMFDSLAEGYELSGDKKNMKIAALQALALLNKQPALSDGDKALKATNESRVKE